MLGSVIAEVTTFGNPLHIVLTLTSLWRKPADDDFNQRYQVKRQYAILQRAK
jgi:hypothetical protein